MKTLHRFAVAAAIAGLSFAQNAYVQLIHNVPDVVGVSTPFVLDSIDIYLSTDNGATWTLAVPDFKFRQATPYTPVPANSNQVIAGIAPGNSTGPADILVQYPLPSFSPNTYNVAIVAGTIDFFGGSANIALFYYFNARSAAQNSSQFEFVVFHGAPDVDTVGVYLAFDRTASAYQPDLTLPRYEYTPNYLGLATDQLVVLDTSLIDLNDFWPKGYEVPAPGSVGLAGQTGVVFASGYANTPDPAKAFGLYVALGSGTVIPLSAVEVRRLQIVHNAADPALAQVDLHPGGVGTGTPISLDFRQATPTFFVAGPVGASVPIAFTPRGQTSPVLATVNISLPAAGSNHAAFAQGVANPSQFAANPNGVSTAFTVHPILNIRGWEPSSSFSFVSFHGVTDAPAVDVYVGSSPVATNLRYLDGASQVTVPAGTSGIVEVRPAGQPTPVATFSLAATQTPGGKGAIVFASGFLNPTANQNGPAFGLYVVYPEGSVEALAPLSTAMERGIPTGATLVVYANPTGQDSWHIGVEATQAGELPYALFTTTGQLVQQGSWHVPGAGTWVYALSAEGLAPGVYCLRVGMQAVRLVRW